MDEREVDDDADDDVDGAACGCGAAALTGALRLILEVPQAVVLRRLGSELCARLNGSGVEALARDQAQALENLETHLDALSHADAPLPSSRIAPSSSKRNELPSFGLGLKRQKSMIPPTLLTDTEAAENTDALNRCAAALGRLARGSLSGVP